MERTKPMAAVVKGAATKGQIQNKNVFSANSMKHPRVSARRQVSVKANDFSDRFFHIFFIFQYLFKPFQPLTSITLSIFRIQSSSLTIASPRLSLHRLMLAPAVAPPEVWQSHPALCREATSAKMRPLNQTAQRLAQIRKIVRPPGPAGDFI